MESYTLKKGRILTAAILLLFIMATVCASFAEQTAAQDESEAAVLAQRSETATLEQNEDETILWDFDGGLWYYNSKKQGLRVEIHRYTSEKPKLLWYEADLQTCSDSPLSFYLANEENMGYGFAYPERIARNNKVVFAINDDHFGYRKYNKKTAGIIIRKGQILNTATRKSGNKSWPTLDCCAFFDDGTFKTYLSKDVTAEEYLEMGAKTVLSFGPYLLSNGEMNPQCEDRFTDRENRMAIGMIAPYHYAVVYVEARNDYSKGTGLKWIAERMKEMGCTEAFNLDGGGTACMLFMGTKIKISNPDGLVRKERSVCGLIGLGTSELVPEFTGVE